MFARCEAQYGLRSVVVVGARSGSEAPKVNADCEASFYFKNAKHFPVGSADGKPLFKVARGDREG